ncbi:MAG TPA: ABC transporter ATP-binding protein [Pyrinomonadaceae bacterium]|jgi:lipopolysaccharide transport system ATP-binding protein
MKPIIKAQGVSKRYRIGAARAAYGTLRDALAGAARAPFRRRARGGGESVWALRDVNFEVQPGEVVGFIGHNGAGKSTLLKILSRITEPTAGRVELYGRVGSLLEVGTGFHPELTGRENIYLNGAILGMRRGEIERKFDEIVAFSEVEKFLDTPVKHYSSGMYMRLAFAVAAHLEPEILIVDEVLAVGDAAFQQKCLGKISSVAQHGRTILFVSHNMAALRNLCHRAVLLEGGTIAAQGETEAVCGRYLKSLKPKDDQDLATLKNRQGRGRVRFKRVWFEDENGNPVAQPVTGQKLVVVMEYQAQTARPLQNCRASIAVTDSQGQVMFICSSELTSSNPLTLPPAGRIHCVIHRLPLSESQYLISPFFEVNHEIEDWIQNATALNVVDGDFYGTGKLYPPGLQGKGVLIPHEWGYEQSA